MESQGRVSYSPNDVTFILLSNLSCTTNFLDDVYETFDMWFLNKFITSIWTIYFYNLWNDYKPDNVKPKRLNILFHLVLRGVNYHFHFCNWGWMKFNNFSKDKDTVMEKSLLNTDIRVFKGILTLDHSFCLQSQHSTCSIGTLDIINV